MLPEVLAGMMRAISYIIFIRKRNTQEYAIFPTLPSPSVHELGTTSITRSNYNGRMAVGLYASRLTTTSN